VGCRDEELQSNECAGAEKERLSLLVVTDHYADAGMAGTVELSPTIAFADPATRVKTTQSPATAHRKNIFGSLPLIRCSSKCTPARAAAEGRLCYWPGRAELPASGRNRAGALTPCLRCSSRSHSASWSRALGRTGGSMPPSGIAAAGDLTPDPGFQHTWSRGTIPSDRVRDHRHALVA
jgi:hypothetical protein